MSELSRLVAFDFETYWDSKSKYSLKNMGPLSYVRDGRFEPLCLAVAASKGSKAFDLTGMDVTSKTFRDLVLVGHNAHGFDGLILSEHYGVRPWRVWDTIAMMHWTGLSRVISCSHESLTEFLGNGTKEAGTVLSDGKRRKDFSDSEWDWFMEYCRADASQCRANAVAMLPYMTADACRFMEITARMAIHPMFTLDRAKLEEFHKGIVDAEATAMDDLAKMFGIPDADDMKKAIRSPTRFADMLRGLGVEPPMKKSEAKTKTMGSETMTYAFAKTDLEFKALLDHDDPKVRALVGTRLKHNSSMPRTRAENLLRFAEAGRPLPVQLSAFKAHTSRYTAGSNEGSTDGLQFQNLSKRDPGKRKLREAIRAPEGWKVVACDSSQIEARVLAWLANETELLEQFREGRDPYAELAGRIFNLDHAEIHEGAKAGDPTMKLYRNVGKTCVLSAGYGVGRDRFSDTLLRQGMALHPTPYKHRGLAWQAHAVYRQTNQRIVAFWSRCESVLDALSQGYTGRFGGPDDSFFEFGSMPILSSEVGVDVPIVPSVRQPSGFVLRYPNLERRSDGFFFTRPSGHDTVDIKIYGAALTENLCQSLAFQLLMWQACRMDEVGIPLHANVHDSFAAVVPEDRAEDVLAAMKLVMSTTPPWMPGFPVACEGEIGDDFTIV